MTICATEGAHAPDSPRRAALTIAADGSYGARLARHDDAAGSWFPERWTLSGPEPYAVPLPGSQPEEPDSELLPLTDGRVLILRRVADRFAVSLLYPTGPGTGELLLGAVEAPELTLLPPSPKGTLGFALAPGEHRTGLWLVHGGTGGPERIAEIPGRCTGGAWLDRSGRLLALDRELDGRTKTITVDLERSGETGLLLQITEESNDRLLLADPDSGLLLVRSDAPGEDRLGWGVLGSRRPVRFPECLRPVGPASGGRERGAGEAGRSAAITPLALTPFAVQPGQMLAPESCAVAFRMDAPHGTWLGTWRPMGRQLRQLPVPAGWLAGTGLWTAGGELLLPCATGLEPCGVARVTVPLPPEPAEPVRRRATVGAAEPTETAEVVEAAEASEAAETVRRVGKWEPVRAWEPVGKERRAGKEEANRLTRGSGPVKWNGPVRLDGPVELKGPVKLKGLRGLKGLKGLEGLEGLERLTSLEGAPPRAGVRNFGDIGDIENVENIGITAATDGGVMPDAVDADNHSTGSAHAQVLGGEPQHAPAHPPMCRPVPLQQAPLAPR
ncbi:hypothetical protein SSP35_12_00330 [Streptomyces sp. NBRC 110611]|uniref:hypothetical protein n=1 Tax=Streptomyces sp. NBRC 110611 TaxID=1621259 RepID=UPI00082B54B6|nr:hypothetical protein SSP35_12_00330 [Streptomyces sp. NBRC 110611]